MISMVAQNNLWRHRMAAQEYKELIINKDYEFARLAVDKAKLCPVDEASGNPMPRVGVVIAKDGMLIGWAAKGVGGEYAIGERIQKFDVTPTEHAEQALLAQLHSVDLTGSSVYVTLEPCTKRKTGRSCADLLVERRIAVVYVGNCDPNPDIGALAWRLFHQHGISVKDFPSDLRNEARRDNAAFFSKFRWSKRGSGKGAFDYQADGGQRVLGEAGKEFTTRWTNRGRGSIYALDYDNNVCIAKNCTQFNQIDDPGRWFEDSHYTKPANEGEIVIFRNRHGFALVQIIKVTPHADGANAELKFSYELRYS